MRSVSFLNILRLLALVLIFITWPLSFFLHNLQEFIFYFAPTFLLILSLILFLKKKVYWSGALLIIGIINPLLALFPLLASVFDLIFLNRKKINLLILIIAVIIFALTIVKNKPDSIFYFDHNDQQVILRNTYLYPNILMARIFQNKLTIYTNRFKFNLFALVDPNNYFFHFHPREITVTNQNLDKFPFLAILFFLTGLYFYKKSPYWKFIFIVLAAAIINLSFLKNFDKNDLILYLPIGLIILGGVGVLFQKKKLLIIGVLSIFLIFSFVQILHLIFAAI